MRLLVIEDEKILAEELKQKFEHDGFATDIATTGIDGEHLGNEEAYDAIILDLGLPDKPGLDVLRSWRQQNLETPVLILTARAAWEEKVDGLKSGADDYLTKPFHYEELLARIQVLVRRSKGHNASTLKAQDFLLNEDTHTIIFTDGEEEPLTGTEFRLLRYFLLNPGKIISKSELTEHVYAYDEDKDSNVIEVYVRRLRDKIGKTRIATKRGQGYVFMEDS